LRREAALDELHRAEQAVRQAGPHPPREPPPTTSLARIPVTPPTTSPARIPVARGTVSLMSAPTAWLRSRSGSRVPSPPRPSTAADAVWDWGGANGWGAGWRWGGDGGHWDRGADGWDAGWRWGGHWARDADGWGDGWRSGGARYSSGVAYNGAEQRGHRTNATGHLVAKRGGWMTRVCEMSKLVATDGDAEEISDMVWKYEGLLGTEKDKNGELKSWGLKASILCKLLIDNNYAEAREMAKSIHFTAEMQLAATVDDAELVHSTRG
jgi:hypothetical protein